MAAWHLTLPWSLGPSLEVRKMEVLVRASLGSSSCRVAAMVLWFLGTVVRLVVAVTGCL